MNNIETSAERQSNAAVSNRLSRDLRQAINIVNAEYQHIDWEDQEFLNSVLTDALLTIEKERKVYAAG